jgi:hypothetical protein
MDRADQPALERWSAYILRPSFAGTRLHYDADNGQIEYRTTKGLTRRMDALDWINKIYEVDPLHCPRCGHQMQIMAFIEDWSVIRKILQHLNLWELPQRAPPPLLLPHRPEAFLTKLSPRQAQQVRASTDSLFWDDVPVYRR